MNKFNEWYTKINEEIAEPVATQGDEQVAEIPTTDVANNRDSMISDIDTIMTSLETLAGELKEELATETLNEDEGSMAKKIIDFTVRAPKARSAQSKVNKMKLKIADIKAASIQADGEAAAKLKGKAEQMKAQADELQKLVDDKFSGQGSIVSKALSSEKIKGQLAVIKAGMGEGDNKSAQKQAAKLKQRLQDEEAALAALKPSSAQESLITRATTVGLDELAEEIASKYDWQVTEGTALYVKYENQIRKVELSNSLNESTAMSIKDKFSKLI